MNSSIKLPKKPWLACLLAAALSTSASAANYVSDDVYTFYHGGPGTEYRITGRIRSGSPVTVLTRNEKTDFIQIKTPSGKVGWMPADKISSGTSLADRYPKLEEQLKQNEANLAAQAEEILALKQHNQSLAGQNAGNAGKVSALEEEIVSLNRTINGMDESNLMRWFTYGGLVAFGGLLLGLMVPYLPKRRKRHDTW
ncbi:TIGR04211 family SH3 domain-containing protein [Amphritea sp. 2_MG-2023]|jgi:SH3 domain protein|uniref:TIGR04211 family SH3 domain-containing protein n=1 Tax=Amphritea TaxID=515417 RepID=UPI001C072EEE|nr:MULTISPECIES: TIGR04211 family SH3 domain-containing protein [Amphritea]MBU2966340.1 TIGR04211 family SH3 domain-containing protein [Amphritea atlantica]MDO6419779.1 TIGR04211 family SH3 domain-containing protein [Amphritea sp. 2_MG-2023]MDX2421420.1 TIGR04211 family SH3 domain-containing protein [Amphritea sp.]